jgi:hypothetical protein
VRVMRDGYLSIARAACGLSGRATATQSLRLGRGWHYRAVGPMRL